ncbi:MAG TPA: hypothetical protein VGM88_17215 [Kofleriaceae bacterium]|jgi:hypothetical protein
MRYALALLLVSATAAADPHFTLQTGYRDVQVFRDGTLVATVTTGAPVAHASLAPKMNPRLTPDLSVDTWLMHGDRRRTHYTFSDGAYHAGASEDVPGPSRPRGSRRPAP